MNIEAVSDDVATITAVGAIAALGLQGVTDPVVLGAVAGLGGYRLRSRARARGGSS